MVESVYLASLQWLEDSASFLASSNGGKHELTMIKIRLTWGWHMVKNPASLPWVERQAFLALDEFLDSPAGRAEADGRRCRHRLDLLSANMVLEFC